jgi:hypothetical protein
MKKVLVILGVIAVLGAVVIIGGGYLVYKKGSSFMAEATQAEIARFISSAHPPERVANSLRRVTNAAVLHPGVPSTMLAGMAMMTLEDRVVSDEEAAMLDEAAQLAEDENVSQEKVAALMKKYEQLFPRRKP